MIVAVGADEAAALSRCLNGEYLLQLGTTPLGWWSIDKVTNDPELGAAVWLSPIPDEPQDETTETTQVTQVLAEQQAPTTAGPHPSPPIIPGGTPTAGDCAT